MSLKFAFGHAVYNARSNFGWTQEEVAEAIGISVRWYQKIEKGEYLPSATVMLRLIILLEIKATPQNTPKEKPCGKIPSGRA